MRLRLASTISSVLLRLWICPDKCSLECVGTQPISNFEYKSNCLCKIAACNEGDGVSKTYTAWSLHDCAWLCLRFQMVSGKAGIATSSSSCNFGRVAKHPSEEGQRVELTSNMNLPPPWGADEGQITKRRLKCA